ncbi:hypothetical protein [Mesorhizobium australicum]|uniref:Uncharacterized protein n=1 Tax=Mesorhizobium australicum TaxID=536018 RepID=A0A1X7NW34_9HYPH|nr:hypothetical protein [Mesorhizobium australicum]SMH42504.1 hypothetical protein SAMN02982922_2752 [Mesorhizobium australicum]
MFNVDEEPTFTGTAKLPPSVGKEPETFTADFRALPIDTFSAFDFSNPDDVKAMLEQSIFNLGDIIDAKKQPVPYSEELRARLLNNPITRAALFRAYVETIGVASRGN